MNKLKEYLETIPNICNNPDIAVLTGNDTGMSSITGNCIDLKTYDCFSVNTHIQTSSGIYSDDGITVAMASLMFVDDTTKDPSRPAPVSPIEYNIKTFKDGNGILIEAININRIKALASSLKNIADTLNNMINDLEEEK